MKGLSLKKKFVFSLLVAGLVPSLVISFYANNKATSSLESEIKNKLTLIRESKSFEVENFVKLIKTQVSDLASSGLTKNAFEAFDKGFQKYLSEVEEPDFAPIKENLSQYYERNFTNKYNEINSVKINNSILTENLSRTSLLLQDEFIAKNKFEVGQKLKLYSINDSSYSRAHQQFHGDFVKYLENYGYYDIFIVDAKSNTVIYSVYKEADFAASLSEGALATSPLAQAYKASVANPKQPYITEISSYWPSLDYPAQFVASAIVIDDEVVGSLIFQIPVEKINGILTGEYKWKDQGFGETGENFLIGSDMSMKSIARELYEDKDLYVKNLKESGAEEKVYEYVSTHNTSAMTVRIDSEELKKSMLSSDKSITFYTSPLGTRLIAAVQKLKLEGLDWYFVSQMSVEEAMASVYDLRAIMTTIVVIATVAVVAFAFVLASTITNQIVKVSIDLKSGAQQLFSSSNKIAEGSSELSSTTDELAASVQETSSSINEISSMITRSAESARKASELSQESQRKARKGKESVQDVRNIIGLIHKSNEDIVNGVDTNNEKIEQINSVIQAIADKTKVINEIVFQTKLLSFNASVEAARAGEQGKGFAVVAEEVGSLAMMSGKAASEIGTLLEESTQTVNNIVQNSKAQMSQVLEAAKKNVENGVSKSIECEEILDEVLNSFEVVNSSVNEIANSSSEQATGVQQVTQAIHEIDSATQLNSSVASESSVRAEELKLQSHTLSGIVVEMEKIVYGEGLKASKVDSIDTPPSSKPQLKIVEKKNKVPSSDDFRFKSIG